MVQRMLTSLPCGWTPAFTCVDADEFPHVAAAHVLRGRPAQFVSIDFAGHGHSYHRSGDAPYLMIQHASDVLAALGSLGWIPSLAPAPPQGSASPSTQEHQSPDAGPVSVSLCGHSMGAGVGSMVLGAAPDVFDGAVLIEALGLPAREEAGGGAYLRAGVAARKALADKEPKPYLNLSHAVAARCATAASWPGDQFLSYSAAAPLVTRGTEAAPGSGSTKRAPSNTPPDVAAQLTDETAPVRFRHSLRVLESSLMYLSEEQVRAFLAAVNCPTCLLLAEKGWPYEASTASERQAVLSAALDAAQDRFTANAKDNRGIPTSPAETAAAVKAALANASQKVAMGQSQAPADVWDDVDAAAASAAREATDEDVTQSKNPAPTAAGQKAWNITPLLVHQMECGASRSRADECSPEAALSASERDADIPVRVSQRVPPFPATAASGATVHEASHVSKLRPQQEQPSWYWGVTLKDAGHHPHLEPGSSAAVRHVLRDFLRTTVLPVAEARLAARSNTQQQEARL